MEHKNMYILLGCHDEGFHTVMQTEATSIEDAIERFDLYPFTWPDDWEDEEDFTREYATDFVRRFYGLGGADSYDHGNYVDGDSNSAFIIVEVAGTQVTTYPPVRK